MGKENNLGDFLKDLAAAIREVTDTTDAINPQDFSTIIRELSGTGLPNSFTKLEYIESSGSQYIDTGVKPSGESFRVITEFEYTATPSSKTLYGAQAGSSTLSFPITVHSSPAKFYVGNSMEILPFTVSQSTRYTLDAFANNGTFTTVWNGVEYQTNYTGSLLKDYPTYLFANNISGNADQLVSARMYSCQIYDNDVLVRDFVPCMNAAGVCGLYDKVNIAFYPSSSSTAFTGA